LALVACMRKFLTILNAMLRERKPWTETAVTTWQPRQSLRNSSHSEERACRVRGLTLNQPSRFVGYEKQPAPTFPPPQTI